MPPPRLPSPSAALTALRHAATNARLVVGQPFPDGNLCADLISRLDLAVSERKAHDARLLGLARSLGGALAKLARGDARDGEFVVAETISVLNTIVSPAPPPRPAPAGPHDEVDYPFPSYVRAAEAACDLPTLDPDAGAA